MTAIRISWIIGGVILMTPPILLFLLLPFLGEAGNLLLALLVPGIVFISQAFRKKPGKIIPEIKRLLG